MKKTLLSILSSGILFTGITAQNDKQAPVNNWPKNLKRCGTEAPSPQWNKTFDGLVEKYIEGLQSGRSAMATSFTIPVICHIIHGGSPIGGGGSPNISYIQANSQIAVLNADYAGTGLNSGNLAATAFSAVGVANCSITFCPATKNPLGQTLPEPGVERINYVDSGWANPASFATSASFRQYIDGTVKAKTIWDPQSYLNIWVTDENLNAVSLLGYATFPSGAPLSFLPGGGGPSDDGCWIYYRCYGDQGQVDYPYNKGRTASHEVGHWLGLRHIGGDGQPNGTGQGNVNGDCTATDGCADTPPQKGGFMTGQYGQNFGNPTYPLHAAVCGTLDPNGDMFMNFMDYVDDAYCYMFTPNQRTRMHAAMNGPICLYRNQLSQSSATQCNNPAAAPVAVAFMPSNVCNTVGVVSTTNQSTGNPIPSYAWSSNPSAGVTFSPNFIATAPSISFTAAGVYTITCAATNSVGTNNAVMTITVDACDVGVMVNSLLATRIGMQPNPTTGKVNITTNLPWAQNLTIRVLNILGQTIQSSEHSNVSNAVIELDLSSQPAGSYFINIDNGTDKVVKRLIISK
jgi:hypothetical protein